MKGPAGPGGAKPRERAMNDWDCPGVTLWCLSGLFVLDIESSAFHTGSESEAGKQSVEFVFKTVFTPLHFLLSQEGVVRLRPGQQRDRNLFLL